MERLRIEKNESGIGIFVRKEIDRSCKMSDRVIFLKIDVKLVGDNI